MSQVSGFYKNRKDELLDESKYSSFTLNHTTLRKLLVNYGEYPSKFRMLIWRFLLNLPDNKESFEVLYAKGIHFTQYNLHKRYPISNSSIFRKIQRIISAMANQSPVFGAVEYLPELIFPFLKVFNQSSSTIFEIMLSFFVNWGKEWFEFFPNPPATVLNYISSLLQTYDNDVLEHLTSIGVSSTLFAWPMLKSLFTEIFTSDQWLRVFDHVFSNPPSFIFMFIVSYLHYFRRSLFEIKERRDAETFFHSIHACDLEKIIAFAYDIQKTQYESSLQKLIAKSYGSFVPLPKGHYNVSIRFPEYSVDYQVKQRERIVRSEEDLDRARSNYIQLKKHNEEFEIEHRNWLIRQKSLIEASKVQEDMSKRMERELLEEKERVRQLELAERLKNVEYLQERRKLLADIQEGELRAKTINQQRNLENLTMDTHNEIKHKLTEMHLDEIEKMEQVKMQDLRTMTSSDCFFTKNPSVISPRQPTTVQSSAINNKAATNSFLPVYIKEEEEAVAQPSQQPSPEKSEIPTTTSTATTAGIQQQTTTTEKPSPSILSELNPTSRESSFADCLQIHLLGNEINSLDKAIESIDRKLQPKEVKPVTIVSSPAINEPVVVSSTTLEKKKVKKKKKSLSRTSRTEKEQQQQEQQAVVKQKKNKEEPISLKKTTTTSCCTQTEELSTKKTSEKPSVVEKQAQTKSPKRRKTPKKTKDASTETKRKIEENVVVVSSNNQQAQTLNQNNNTSNVSNTTTSSSSKSSSSIKEEMDNRFKLLQDQISKQKSELKKSDRTMKHIESISSNISKPTITTTSANKQNNSNISTRYSSGGTSPSIESLKNTSLFNRFDYLKSVDARVDDLIQKKFKEFMSRKNSEPVTSERSFSIEEQNLSFPTTTSAPSGRDNNSSSRISTSPPVSTPQSKYRGNSSGLRGTISATLNPSFAQTSTYMSPFSNDGIIDKSSDNESSSDVNSLLRHSSEFETTSSKRMNLSSDSHLYSASSRSYSESSGNKSKSTTNGSHAINAIVSISESPYQSKTSEEIVNEISDTRSIEELLKSFNTSYPSISSSIESIKMKPHDYSSLDLSFFSETSETDEFTTSVNTSALMTEKEY